MHTLTLTTAPDHDLFPRSLPALKAKCRQIAPMAGIVAAHLIVFYLLQNGMLQRVVHAALPEVINISFIAPPPPPPPAAAPAEPKTVQLAAPLPPPTLVPPLPPLNLAPNVASITAPPAAATAPVSAPAVVSAPAAPAATSDSTAPRTVSSVEYIRAPQPVYPGISRRLGESGTVLLRILISEQGLPQQVTVQKSSGSNNLDEAGRQAALRALFKPQLDNGRAVPVFVIIPLNFQLG